MLDSRNRRTAGIAMYRKQREEEQVALIRNHDNKWMNENSDKENHVNKTKHNMTMKL